MNNHVQEIISYCQMNVPNEVCGLLIGKDTKVDYLIFITNQYHSPTRFFMEPIELLNAFNWMDEKNLELLGIFHSHPNGPDHPSKTDVIEFNYPGVSSVIIAKKFGRWVINAFDIKNQTFKPDDIKLIPNDPTD